MKHALTALGFTLVLAACSSGVKLNQASVEDLSGKPVQPAPLGSTTIVTPNGNAGAGVVSPRDVTPVQLTDASSSMPGPKVARVLYFDYDSYSIKPEFQSALEAHAKYLNADRSRKMAIEGHTDERGGREYNLALGQKRSEAVRRALGLLGVTEVQLEAVSFGKEKPASQGTDEASMAQNRRAEMNYR